MNLAWQNILHDRARFLATLLGVSFAAFLMVFQGSLLVGFLQAASRLIDASDFDIWITARGVQAFEFGARWNPACERWRPACRVWWKLAGRA